MAWSLLGPMQLPMYHKQCRWWASVMWRDFRSFTNDGERERREDGDDTGSGTVPSLPLTFNGPSETGVPVMGSAVVDCLVDMEQSGWLGSLPVVPGQGLVQFSAARLVRWGCRYRYINRIGIPFSLAPTRLALRQFWVLSPSQVLFDHGSSSRSSTNTRSPISPARPSPEPIESY